MKRLQLLQHASFVIDSISIEAAPNPYVPVTDSANRPLEEVRAIKQAMSKLTKVLVLTLFASLPQGSLGQSQDLDVMHTDGGNTSYVTLMPRVDAGNCHTEIESLEY